MQIAGPVWRVHLLDCQFIESVLFFNLAILFDIVPQGRRLAAFNSEIDLERYT